MSGIATNGASWASLGTEQWVSLTMVFVSTLRTSSPRAPANSSSAKSTRRDSWRDSTTDTDHRSGSRVIRYSQWLTCDWSWNSNGQNGSHPFTVARQIPCNLLSNKSIQMLTRVSCRVAFALPHLATRLLILFMGCSMQCFLQTMPVESRVATMAKKTSSLELRFISQQTHA